MFVKVLAFFLLYFCKGCVALGEVVWAVNCGGDAVVDSNGIRYMKDSLTQGVPSDYGKNMMINRVPAQDQIIYQTERYHSANFGYEVPIPGDGDYVLILKFSEVWFTAPNQKVFDVVLNGDHTIVEHLDIYSKVGRGTAHDEIIPFKVKHGILSVNGESSDLYYNKVPVEFIKGDRDNPKINAIVLMRGTIDDVPKLPAMPGLPTDHFNDQNFRNERSVEEQDHVYNEDNEGNFKDDFDSSFSSREGMGSKGGSGGSSSGSRRKRPVSGPKTPNPYATDDTSTMLLPVIIAIAAFLPIVFCLCKL